MLEERACGGSRRSRARRVDTRRRAGSRRDPAARGGQDGSTLAATDMEISLRASLGGEIAGDASVVVPGRLLTDLVRLLPDDTVTLAYEEGEGMLVVTSGSHSSRLNVYSAEDFPRLPPLDVPLHRIEAGALLETIDKVGRAASRDESRPVLTGILVRFEGRKARHGRDRLVSARGQGDPAHRRWPGPRGDHPGASASGARPYRGRERGRRARRPREPRDLLAPATSG